MCRYAEKTYKPHFSCFKCRKVFKKPPIEDFLKYDDLDYIYKKLLKVSFHKTSLQKLEREYNHTLDDLEKKYISSVGKCPDCGNQMVNMGLDFRAPKKKDTKAWEIFESMYEVGHNFHTCGCDAFGYVPKDKIAHLEYLKERKHYFESLLKGVHENTDMIVEEKSEKLKYWANKIQLVTNEIEKIG